MSALENHEIRVRGTVQGVGFRPTVYRLAIECQLTGEVSNDTDGVLMRLSGIQKNIQQFLHRLKTEAPPLAKIDSIEASLAKDSDASAESWRYHDFTIRPSSHIGNSEGHTEIAADAASCTACLNEILNPKERRYLYPFTNCTHCGPRLSIVQGIPYDRSNTTMAEFPLCEDCLKEYSNPLDRRFHAQPIACHQCGPGLFLYSDGNFFPTTTRDNNEEHIYQKLQHINQALNAGKIIAIKGLGGFQLCCDASNHETVNLLRMRKKRYGKPFALMCHDLSCIKQYCQVSDKEQILLQSVEAPIVLLQENSFLKENSRQSHNARKLSRSIAPGSNLLGFMLPSTPLHHLICKKFAKPLVMTSGNFSGEPQIIDNNEALEKLSTIADLIVYHDRDIANRIDDSVVRVISGRVRVIRRARGYAPRSLQLPDGFAQADKILAYGAELKSTFCLVKQGTAILSQHQGDLENINTLNDYENNIALYKTLFEFEPRYLAFDMHPEYLSSKLARGDAADKQLTAIEVQHHHAHIASAMAENNLPVSHPAVLGIALDGLGFGDDGTLWGGEFLLADYCGFQRVARLKPVTMPGAARAVKQPWRNTFAQILTSMSWDDFSNQYGNTELAKFFSEKPIATLQAMLVNNMNCPMASSAGRLFDAVAGALGLSADQVQFEGQAAIELELLADVDAVLSKQVSKPYKFTIAESSELNASELNASSQSAMNAEPNTLLELNASNIWPNLLADIQQGESSAIIATRFHAGLIDGIINMLDLLREKFQFNDVVLSGGCMQNAILLQGLEQAIKERKLNCLTHSFVPANDGGIALGQAVIAAARIITES